MVRTVAVIDFAHCGTTMIAGIYEIFGVPMCGPNCDVRCWEDLDIILPAKNGDLSSLAAFVEQRNEQHSIWGFKFPGMLQHCPELCEMLTDPAYIAIYKDLVSVTRRRFGRSDRRLYRKMLNTARQMERSMGCIERSGLRVHLFSYQKELLNPEVFVKSLAEIAGMEPREDVIAKAVSYILPNTDGPRKPYPAVGDFL